MVVYYRCCRPGAGKDESNMERNGKPGDLEEIFEILVTSYSQRGGAVPGEADLCWRPAADAYETQRVLEAALLSAQNRCAVKMSEVR